jgi:AraC-like DNA-binding protein
MSDMAQGTIRTRLLAAAVNGEAPPAIPSMPSYGSANCQWDGIVLERHVLAPGEIGTTVMPQHCLAVPLSPSSVAIRWRLNDRSVSGAMRPGHVYFRAAGDALSSEWDTTLDAIYLSINPEMVALAHELANLEGLPSTELRTDLSGDASKGLTDIVLGLDSHIRGNSWGGRMHEQTLLMNCSLRIAYDYAIDRNRNRAPIPGNLSPRVLRKLDDFVLDNLSQELSIDAIAVAVGLSSYHLCRTFRKTRGISLWQYVLSCRIQLAVKYLRRYEGIPLAEVAAACGFDSYTQFYESLRKYCAATPTQLRRKFHKGAAASESEAESRRATRLIAKVVSQ